MKPRAVRWLFGLIATIAAAGLAFAAMPPGTAPAIRADPFDPMAIGLGYQVVMTQCAGCHGARLDGVWGWKAGHIDPRRHGPPLNGANRIWLRSDQALFRQIAVPPGSPRRSANPHTDVADRLTPAQLTAALAFVKTAWSRPARFAQAIVSRDAGILPWPWRQIDWRYAPGCDIRAP